MASSSSSPSRSHKRRRSDSDSDGRGKRGKKHKKEKDGKKHKSHKRDEKKRHKEERRRTERPPAGAPPSETIGEGDYFLKSAEYAHWLLEERSSYLEDLTSDEARRIFKKFVARWNAGELSATYYAGIKTTAQPGASRTRHVWGFAQKLSEVRREPAPTRNARVPTTPLATPTPRVSRLPPLPPQNDQMKLDRARDGVDSQTHRAGAAAA